jgi:hypothetical protein
MAAVVTEPWPLPMIRRFAARSAAHGRVMMAELVRVAHDAHGLDAAFDDIHREHAPDPELSLLLGHGPSRSVAGGVSDALHVRGELLGVDVAGLQEPQRLVGREPLGFPKLRLGRASHQAAGLAVDPYEPGLELAGRGAHPSHGIHWPRCASYAGVPPGPPLKSKGLDEWATARTSATAERSRARSTSR